MLDTILDAGIRDRAVVFGGASSLDNTGQRFRGIRCGLRIEGFALSRATKSNRPATVGEAKRQPKKESRGKKLQRFGVFRSCCYTFADERERDRRAVVDVKKLSRAFSTGQEMLLRMRELEGGMLVCKLPASGVCAESVG